MREDMSKKLVERGRWGRNHARAQPRRSRLDLRGARASGDWESLGRREGIAPRNAMTSPSENLMPLRRFLQKRCGRPWDRVYAELRERLSPRSVIHMHIMQHLFDFVQRHVEVRPDGIWVLPGAGRWWRTRRLRRDGQTFYVHPTSGLLLEPRTPRGRASYRRDKVERAVPYVDGPGDLLYLKLQAGWFEVTLGPVQHGAHDAVLRRPVWVCARTDGSAAERRAWYGRADLMAVSKRQLGKREIKAITHRQRARRRRS